MRSRLISMLFAIVVFVAIGSARPYPGKTLTAPKAEDDFQLIKVADGVYAAIAKPGGLDKRRLEPMIGIEPTTY